MDVTLLFIIYTVITVIINIVIKVVWEWASNKNGKNQLENVEKTINDKIEEQRKEFADLKSLILTSYVKKDIFEKHLDRFEEVRDKTLRNENNISMITETVRQNVQRMSQLENK